MGFLTQLKLIMKKRSLYKKNNGPDKQLYLEEYRKSKMGLFTFRRLWVYTLITNFVAITYYTIISNERTYSMSVSRAISKRIGWIMDLSVPTFMRKFVFGFYIWFYNVNKDDILESDLTKYRSLSEFFTRKIKVFLLFHNNDRWKEDLSRLKQ